MFRISDTFKTFNDHKLPSFQVFDPYGMEFKSFFQF